MAELVKPADSKPGKQYSEHELERLFQEAGKKGAILALLHFDAYGQDKQVIANALVDLVGRVTHEPGVIYARGEIEEVMERDAAKEEGTQGGEATGEEGGEGTGKEAKPLKKEYSTFTEVKVLFSSLSRAVSLCFKYAPVGIEVLEPKELKLNTLEVQHILLDAAGISQQYTNYFMQEILKKDPAELNDFQKHLRARADQGKANLEKAKEEQARQDESGQE